MNNWSLGKTLILVGVLCLIFAIGLTGYNMWDSERASETAAKAVAELSVVMPETVRPAEMFVSENLRSLEPENPEMETTYDAYNPQMEVPYYVLNPEIEMLEKEIDGISYIGILEIPALEMTLPVISQWSEFNGSIAPCRYTGSAYLDDLVICAHNYLSHFGQLSSLALGETILFTDMEGNQFTYRIQEIEVLAGAAIEQMCSGDWDMTLFTCTIGGASRVTVRCEKDI